MAELERRKKFENRKALLQLRQVWVQVEEFSEKAKAELALRNELKGYVTEAETKIAPKVDTRSRNDLSCKN